MTDKSAPPSDVLDLNPAVAPAAPTKKVVKRVVVVKKRSSLTGAVAPPSQPAPSVRGPTDSSTANAGSVTIAASVTPSTVGADVDSKNMTASQMVEAASGSATAAATTSVSAKASNDTTVAALSATPTPQPAVAPSASDSASLTKEPVVNEKEEKALEPPRSQKDQDEHDVEPKKSKLTEKETATGDTTSSTPSSSGQVEEPSEKSGVVDRKGEDGISGGKNNTYKSPKVAATTATNEEAIRSLASAMVGAAMDSAAMESSLSAMAAPGTPCTTMPHHEKEEQIDNNTCIDKATAVERPTEKEPTASIGAVEEVNNLRRSSMGETESASHGDKTTAVVVGVPPKAKPAPAPTAAAAARASSKTKGAVVDKSKTPAAVSGVAKKTSPSPRPAVAKKSVPAPVAAKTKTVAPTPTPVAPSSVAPEPADDEVAGGKTSQVLPDPSSSPSTTAANPNPDPNVTTSRRSSRDNSSANKIESEGGVVSSSSKAVQLDKTKQTANSSTTSRAKSLPPARSFSNAAKKGPPAAPISVGAKKKPQLSREELEAQHKARLAAMENREKKRRAEAREQLAKVEASLGDVLTRARDYVVEAKEKERTERLDRMAARRQLREDEKERLEAIRSLHPMAALLAAAAISNAAQALEREETAKNNSVAGEAHNMALPTPSGPNDTQAQTPKKATGSSVVSDSPARTRSPNALLSSPAGGTSSAAAAAALLSLDLTPDHLKPLLAAYAQQEANRQRLQKASKIDAAREQEERRRAEEELAARRARLEANKFVPLSVLKQQQQQQQVSDGVGEGEGEGEAQNGDNIPQNVKENEKKNKQPQQIQKRKAGTDNNQNTTFPSNPQLAKKSDRDRSSSSSSASSASSASSSSSSTMSLSTASVSTPRTEEMAEEDRQRIYGDLKKQKEEKEGNEEEGNAVVISADERQREKEKREEAKKLKDLQRRERRAEQAEEKRANKKKAKLEEKKQLRMRMKNDIVDAAKQEEGEEAKVHATRSDKGEKARKSVAIEAAASAVASALKSNNNTPDDDHEKEMAGDTNRSKSCSSSSSVPTSLSEVSSVSSVSNTFASTSSSSSISSTKSVPVHMNPRKGGGYDNNDERNKNSHNDDSDDIALERALRERIAEWKAQTKAARKAAKMDEIKKKKMEGRDEEDEAEKRKRRKEKMKKKKREEKDAARHRHAGAEDDEKVKIKIPFGRLAVRKEQLDLDNSPLNKHNNNTSNFQTLEEIREQFLVERRANTRDFQIQQGILRRQHMFEYGRQVEQALFGGGDSEAAANNESEITAISPLKKRKQKHLAAINTTETAQKPQLSPEEELARHKKTVAIGNAYMREAKEKTKGSVDESSGRPSAAPPMVLTSGGEVPDVTAKKVKAIGDSYLREMAKKRKEMMKRNNNDASNDGETQHHTGSSSPARLRPLPGAPQSASNPLLSQEALERARKEVVALNRKMLLQPLKPLSESAASYANNTVSSHQTPFSAPTGGISGSEKGPSQGPSTVGGARRLPPLPASPSPSSPSPSGESPHDPIVDAINAKMRLLRMLEGNKASASPSLGGGPSTLGPQRPPRTLKPLGNTK